jgi:hypothetical protein
MHDVARRFEFERVAEMRNSIEYLHERELQMI